MAVLSYHGFPEVFLSTASIRQAVADGVRRGLVRRLASRLYTTNLEDSPEEIVRRHLWQIVGLYMPGALIADRTALENRPAPDGSIFLIDSKKREIELPGPIVLRPRAGAPPLESDTPFVGALRLSSQARAYLENMRPSRSSAKKVARTLSRKELEERLDLLLRQSGEAALGRLRDEARAIAPKLGLEAEARSLDDLIGTLLGSRQAQVNSAVALARTAGRPLDPARMELFQVLHAALRDTAPVPRPEPTRSGEGQRTLAFFEAYFSNYIEGTEFEVSEAAEIVFEGKIPRNRAQDAHDVLGTWRVVSSKAEMRRVPRTVEELVSLLCERHVQIMGARTDKRPGEFKQIANRAGATQFVDPELVLGTLAAGFDYHRSLSDPFHRAVFMMFLVAEVHPFDDGNGRAARIMMNAELAAAGEERIVIPTVYRDNHLAGLRAMSRGKRPDALIRTLDFAQRYTQRLDWGTLEETRRVLETTNAFRDSEEAESQGLKLVMP